METKLKIYGALLILMLFCQKTFAQATGNNFLGTTVGSGPAANSSCTWLGDRAGSTTSTGTYNTYVGAATGQSSTSGSQNVFVGTEAGYLNTSGTYNTFVGSLSGRSNTTGEKNTFVGTNAGRATTTGSWNTFMGLNSGIANTTGYGNAFFGYISGTTNTTGYQNSFFGDDAGKTNTSGFNNSALGSEALYTNSTGTYNAALGFQALNLTTAGFNIGIGASAGTTNTTGTYNTFLGYGADATANNLTNATAIGNGAVVLSSNTMQLANSSSTTWYFGTGALTTTAGNPNMFYNSATGQITRSTSSKRYKTDIVDLQVNSSKIYDLRPVSYTSTVPADKGMRQFGLVAEEVALTIPELAYYAREIDVIPGSTSEKLIPDAVQYSLLAVLLLEEMKKHENKIGQIVQQNTKLEQMLIKQDSIVKLQNAKIDAQQKQISVLTNNRNNNSGTTSSSMDVNLKDGQTIVLDQNVPNPFAEQTIINYFLPDNAAKAQMLFYNAEGKLIQSIVLKEKGKGSLNVFAGDLSYGIYTYTLIVDGKIIETKKMIKQ
jgi:trimeric autotransporter adhesin